MKKYKIAIIGLGYVGLPLAVEFAKKYTTVGFDINEKRVLELKNGIDKTLEIEGELLSKVQREGKLKVTHEKHELSDSNIYIVTVPTPTDKNNRPVLFPLICASEIVGSVMKKGDIVIYESTVYPGVTEDICVPILIDKSNLVFNQDFYVGYSPERINPGDKHYTLTKIRKVTSGSTLECANKVDEIYNSIITAGTFKVSSIKVAEAAKVIENSQRDINIAFVNELAKIFNILEIDTEEVLKAASTKWNFLNFKPGLVGGHCIGVDPYYLAQKAQEVGYHSEIILAGRRLNDGMGKYVASEFIKLMLLKDIRIKDSNILILGFTFKENCPDFRNTKVIDIINELNSYSVNLTIVDPLANPLDVENEYQVTTLKEVPNNFKYDGILLAVTHDHFLKLNILDYAKSKSVIYDVKSVLNRNIVDGRL